MGLFFSFFFYFVYPNRNSAISTSLNSQPKKQNPMGITPKTPPKTPNRPTKKSMPSAPMKRKMVKDGASPVKAGQMIKVLTLPSGNGDVVKQRIIARIEEINKNMRPLWHSGHSGDYVGPLASCASAEVDGLITALKYMGVDYDFQFDWYA